MKKYEEGAKVYYCDKCGDELYVCGEDEMPFTYFAGHPGDYDEHYCWDCWRDTDEFGDCLTAENMTKFGGDDDVKLNAFLAWVYDKDEIEDILWKDFNALSEERQKEFMADFVEDTEDFYDFLWKDGQVG